MSGANVTGVLNAVDVTNATEPRPVLGRLLNLLQVLRMAPQGLTDEQLAGACRVSSATVRGDLRQLAEYLPLWNEADDEPDEPDEDQPGEEDGERTAGRPWHFEEGGCVLPPVPLTPPEAWALLEAMANLGEESSLRQVQRRLREALLGQAPGEEPAGSILVKGVRPVYDGNQSEARLRQLEKAVRLHRRLQLRYRSSAGVASERKVDPYGLLYYWVQGAWYLVGHCHLAGEMRTFRLDRLAGLQELGERFEYPADFCLEDHFRHAWGVDRGELQEVRIRFWDHFNVLARVRKETGHRRDRTLTPEPGGTWLYTDVVAGLSEIRVWVRSFGESAEVLTPQALRQATRESAEQILERYGVRG